MHEQPKTKEMVVDFGMKTSKQLTVVIRSTEVELVSSLRYLRVQRNSKLDWKTHMDALRKKGQN